MHFRRQLAHFWIAVGLAAQPLFVTGVVIAGAAIPGYNPVRDALSQLGITSPHPALVGALFVTYGTLMLCVTFALREALRELPSARAMLFCLGCYGVGAILAGAFPYHSTREVVKGVSENALHGVGAWFVFGGVILAIGSFSLDIRRDPRWHLFLIASLAIEAAAFPLALIVAAEVWLPVRGLMQRLMGLAVDAWIFALLLRTRSMLRASTALPARLPGEEAPGQPKAEDQPAEQPRKVNG